MEIKSNAHFEKSSGRSRRFKNETMGMQHTHGRFSVAHGTVHNLGMECAASGNGVGMGICWGQLRDWMKLCVCETNCSFCSHCGRHAIVRGCHTCTLLITHNTHSWPDSHWGRHAIVRGCHTCTLLNTHNTHSWPDVHEFLQQHSGNSVKILK